MPKVTKPANQKGEFLVDYEEKVLNVASGVRSGGDAGLIQRHRRGLRRDYRCLPVEARGRGWRAVDEGSACDIVRMRRRLDPLQPAHHRRGQGGSACGSAGRRFARSWRRRSGARLSWPRCGGAASC